MKNELEDKGFVEIKMIGAGKQACVVLAKIPKNNFRYAIKGYRVKCSGGEVLDEEK